MKKLMLVSLIALIANTTLAADGKAASCYDMALPVPSAFTQNGADGENIYLRTGGTICTTEKNMVDQDADAVISVGEIKIVIKNNGRKVAEYNMVARSGDATLGTYHIVYATNVEDLQDFSGDSNYKMIHFAMRNDHIKRGEYAGRVELNGNNIILLER